MFGVQVVSLLNPERMWEGGRVYWSHQAVVLLVKVYATSFFHSLQVF